MDFFLVLCVRNNIRQVTIFLLYIIPFLENYTLTETVQKFTRNSHTILIVLIHLSALIATLPAYL